MRLELQKKVKKIGIMINFLNLNLKHSGPNHLVLICQKQSFFHLAVALMEDFLEGITLIKTMVHKYKSSLLSSQINFRHFLQ